MICPQNGTSVHKGLIDRNEKSEIREVGGGRPVSHSTYKARTAEVGRREGPVCNIHDNVSMTGDAKISGGNKEGGEGEAEGGKFRTFVAVKVVIMLLLVSYVWRVYVVPVVSTVVRLWGVEYRETAVRAQPKMTFSFILCMLYCNRLQTILGFENVTGQNSLKSRIYNVVK